MSFKKLQTIIDKGIAVLSDHDEKKDEKRYINLQNAVEEAQDYVEKGIYSSELNNELYYEIHRCIKEFERDNLIFIIFLIILCGLLFVGVFYITYSHFFDHWYHGGHFIPPKPPIKTTRYKTTYTHDINDTTTTKHNIKTTTSSSKTTSVPNANNTTNVVTTNETTTKITQVVPDDSVNGFVTVLFDNSALVDFDNIYPMLDSDGLNTSPTTWKLSSSLSKGSKDYVVQYTINFIDLAHEIEFNKRLDISDLKFNLLTKNNGVVQYNSGVQYLSDYPELKGGIRPVVTINTLGNTFKNGETLDFELRIWLDSMVGNESQGKQYKLKIDVEATYDFIE